MWRVLLWFAVFLAVDGLACPAPRADERPNPATALRAAEWSAYKARFLDAASGRIRDPEQGGITHSEGQGYGMLLALEAGDRATFDRIWDFTRREMQIRDGRLISWRWDPYARPHVTDANNASDGDVLVAYALLRAGLAWDAPAYLRAARAIVRDIGRTLLARRNGYVFLRPGAFGFDRTAGNAGPVINLSYYVYPAFSLFDVVAPSFPWLELARDGFHLTRRARAGALGLVPDWISLGEGRRVAPAAGFSGRSAYDAVRLPLYMMLAGHTPPHLRYFDRAWNMAGDGRPLDYDLRADCVRRRMRDPGYELIAALVACGRRGAGVPIRLTRFRATTYFASTLHLLSLSALRRHHPACLPADAADAPREDRGRADAG